MAKDKERKQSLFIVAYKGRDTAEKVYDTLHDLQKQKKVKIKTAMVVNRKDNGKLKLVHKHRMKTWGGGAASVARVALLLAGVGGGAVLAGAVVGASARRLWPHRPQRRQRVPGRQAGARRLGRGHPDQGSGLAGRRGRHQAVWRRATIGRADARGREAAQ